MLQNQPAFLDDYKEVHNEVLAQVMKSITHLNWNVPEQSAMTILVSEISNSIRNNYKQLRKDEIATCFSKGIRGEYGEFMGLSVVTFEKFIMGYLASDYRATLGKTLPVAHIEQRAEPTPAEQWDNFVKRLCVIYAEYLKGTRVHPSEASFCYTVLKRNGFLKLDQQRKEKIQQKAFNQIKTETDPKNALNIPEKRKMNAAYEQLLSKSGDDSRVINRAKALGLYEWFDDLRIMEISIEEAVREDF